MSQQINTLRRANDIEDLYGTFEPCAVYNLKKVLRRLPDKASMVMRYIRRGTICVETFAQEFDAPPSKETAVQYAHDAMPMTKVIYTQNAPLFQYGGKDRENGELFLRVNHTGRPCEEASYLLTNDEIIYILS